MTGQEAAELIHQRAWVGQEPGLERIRRLLGRLGDPQKELRSVHIAGSNGKGLTLLSRAGWFEYVDDVATRSRVMVTLSKHELYSLRLEPTADKVFQLLLRTYTGLFADYVNISEELIATRLGRTAEDVYQAMLSLSRVGAVSYVPHSNTPYLFFTTSREETKYILIPKDIYETRREVLERRVRAMQTYVFSPPGCRVEYMLKYFGDSDARPCGKCDICREQRPVKELPKSIDDTILYIAAQPGGHSPEYIAAQIGVGVDQIIPRLRSLLDCGKLLPEQLKMN